MEISSPLRPKVKSIKHMLSEEGIKKSSESLSPQKKSNGQSPIELNERFFLKSVLQSEVVMNDYI